MSLNNTNILSGFAAWGVVDRTFGQRAIVTALLTPRVAGPVHRCGVRQCSSPPSPRPENWQDLKYHEIARVFPVIDSEQWQDLMESVHAGWQKGHPIVLYEGEVLDGCNRHRVLCDLARQDLALAINATFVEFVGDRDEAVQYSLRENLARRHLTAGQRAIIGDKLATLKHGGDRKSADFKTTIVPLENMSMCKVCDSLHINPRTIMRARELQRIDPEGANRVRNGKQSLNAALVAAKKAAGTPKRPVKIPPRPAQD